MLGPMFIQMNQRAWWEGVRGKTRVHRTKFCFRLWPCESRDFRTRPHGSLRESVCSVVLHILWESEGPILRFKYVQKQVMKWVTTQPPLAIEAHL